MTFFIYIYRYSLRTYPDAIPTYIDRGRPFLQGTYFFVMGYSRFVVGYIIIILNYVVIYGFNNLLYSVGTYARETITLERLPFLKPPNHRPLQYNKTQTNTDTDGWPGDRGDGKTLIVAKRCVAVTTRYHLRSKKQT